MARTYVVLDHTLPLGTSPDAGTVSRHPCADEALAAARALAHAKVSAAKGDPDTEFSAVVEDQWEDGTMFWGEVRGLVNGERTGEVIALEPLVRVDELGR